MTKAILLLVALVSAATPALADRRDRARHDAHRLRNAAIAVMLLLDDEHANCVVTYAQHYGDNVDALCERDILNADNVPQDLRDQWRAWRDEKG